MIKIIKSRLFENYPEVIFGFSTKIGLGRNHPFYFNMSKSVEDDEKIVNENRNEFFKELNLKADQIAYQKQIHSKTVRIVDSPGMHGEGDALITNKEGIGLAVSSADCAPIFIYDNQKKVIAGIHSGWKGTSQKIVEETLTVLQDNFTCNPNNLIVYIGPSISQMNYEVGKEFENIFDPKYLHPQNGKFKLDVKQANYDMLINFGISESQIEVSNLCSYQEEYLHSYRRDGLKSGRAFGIIALQ